MNATETGLYLPPDPDKDVKDKAKELYAAYMRQTEPSLAHKIDEFWFDMGDRTAHSARSPQARAYRGWLAAGRAALMSNREALPSNALT